MEVQEDIAATFRHLVSVIDGNEKAAQLLADIIHAEISLETNEAQILRDKLDFELPLNELAIWIDPIGKMLFLLWNVLSMWGHARREYHQETL